MEHSPDINHIGRTTPVQPTTPPKRVDNAADVARHSEFEALLENLQERAEALERAATGQDAPDGAGVSELKDSMRTAKETFREAMDVGERLIEAYRRSRIEGMDE